ncbi:hypothetical protein BGX33_010515, partial [Mortierella sp. NVP41]
MNDITDVFPTTLRLQNGTRVVSLMVDSEGNRYCSEPPRVEYQPGCTIQVIPHEGQAIPHEGSTPFPQQPPPIPPRITSQKGAFKYDSLKVLDIQSHDPCKRATVLLEAPHLPADAKIQFRRSIILYDSFLQSIRNGQTEDTNIIRNDFRNHFAALKDEMAKNTELQQQMLEMQQSMTQMQQQTLDRLALIQNRVQAIL